MAFFVWTERKAVDKMHMADALVTPVVGGVMMAVSAGAIGYSVRKVKEDLDDKKVPLMGVMGAFVFAGQMVNFTIPATGSSGHIGGGILLAALLGPYAAFLVLSAVVIIQALFFADGGLLALGCNLFNMGFFACFVAYPLIYRPIVNRRFTPKRIAIAAVASAIAGLQLGSFSVVLETMASGIAELPFAAFAALMQPIHLAIGLVEGIATAAVLNFIYQCNPNLLDGIEDSPYNEKLSKAKIIALLLTLAIVLGGVVSLLASNNPDGLEWSLLGTAGTTELHNGGILYQIAAKLQEITAFMPDYSFQGDKTAVLNENPATRMLGAGITLGVTCLAGFLITRYKKKVKDDKCQN